MRILPSIAEVQPRITVSGFIADGICANQARYQFTISAAVVAILGVGIAMASVAFQPQTGHSTVAMQTTTRHHAILQAQMPMRTDLGG